MGLGYDQASFAILGKHAVDTFSLPLLGPFSSDSPFQTAATTRSLLLYLSQSDLLDPNGYRIGLSMLASVNTSEAPPPIATSAGGIILVDLESSSSSTLLHSGWAYLDFPVLYKSVQKWWADR